MQQLELYKKISELTSQVTGNEFENFEAFGLAPSTNMLDANMGIEEIEPEKIMQPTQDYNNDNFDNDLGGGGLDLGGMDFKLKTKMHDLGEFVESDDYDMG